MMKKKKKKHKPDDLKLVYPRDEGKVVITNIFNYNNGQVFQGRIYTYHPTKGWRSRCYKEFKPYKAFDGIKLGG